MPRLHNREFFFKYYRAEVAEMVLASAKLMWSAPHLFNDPFDHQISYRFPFTWQQAADRIFQIQQEIVFGHNEPKFVEEKELGVLSYLLRRAKLRGERKLTAVQEMREGANATVARFGEFQQTLNDQLKAFLGHSRVLCVSETNSNVVMWSHYADEHRGAVVKLKCMDEIDDNLLAARKVSYVDKFPEFLSLDNWAKSQFGLYKIDYGKLALDLAFTKHSDWKYENEWRVHMPLMPHEPALDGRGLFSKNILAFAGLYLGCRIEPGARARLIDLADKCYPHMEVYDAVLAKQSFGLEFVRVR